MNYYYSISIYGYHPDQSVEAAYAAHTAYAAYEKAAEFATVLGLAVALVDDSTGEILKHNENEL